MQYDLHSRFGWGVERLEQEAVSWNDAWDLVSRILMDPYSHCCASVEGFAYVPTPEDVRFYDDLDVQAMRNRGKNQPRPTPIKRPWVGAVRARATRSDPASAERRTKLNARLGIA